MPMTIYYKAKIMHSKCIVYITSFYQEGTIFISIIHEVTEGHNGYVLAQVYPDRIWRSQILIPGHLDLESTLLVIISTVEGRQCNILSYLHLYQWFSEHTR